MHARMTAVDTKGGIRYGLELVRYLIMLAIAATVLTVISAGFISLVVVLDNIALVLLFFLLSLVASVVSFVVVLGGLAGLSYKVIADGVSIGNRHAEHVNNNS
jgi:hypothetical protein